MMKHLVVFGAIAVLATPLSGCPRERYTLRLEVDEHELKRELTVEGLEEKKIPKADLRALKKIYRAKPRKLDKQKYRVNGTFRGSTPDDIGGGNTAAQRKQFGKVVFEGAELFDYTNFYNTLSDVHREQWDPFLAGLNASNIDRLLDFTFDGDDMPAVHAHLPFALFYKAVSGKPVPEPPESETPPAK